MSLRVVEYARSQRFVILTECPACGYEFDEQEARHTHLATHSPADLGLTPLGERPESTPNRGESRAD